MLDEQGRNIHYLRISVTDRCNLRCTYCMPKMGVEWIRHDEILSYEEILRLAKCFTGLGIDRIRLTGGEPLVRKDIHILVQELKKLPGVRWVGLTTNGVLLSEQLPKLLDAGLDAVNISLDTLDPAQFTELTGRDQLQAACKGLEAARAAGTLRVKVNCVATWQNREQWVPLARLARSGTPIDVRYIELMPIGCGKTLSGCLESDVLGELEKAFGPAQVVEEGCDCGPSRQVTFEGFTGRIGFISALSHKFCSSCNRVRLTAGGVLKPCLQYDSDVDLKYLLRSGADDEKLTEVIKECILQKPAAHHFGADMVPQEEERNMNQIGG